MAISSKSTAKSRIRDAEPKDIDTITTGMITSLSSDAMWRYRFAHRERYPEDLLKYARLYIELLVSGSFADYATLIVEVEEGSSWNVAAFSIWDISYENKRVYAAKGETYTSLAPYEAMEAAGVKTRKDTDPIYDAAFLKVMSDARKDFTAMFEGNEMYLSLICTHPDFRRRGYATQLLKWGIERAERDNAPLVLVASPMGEPTYLATGFEELGRVDVVVEGDYEKQEIVKMIYRPRK
ncbi:717eb6c2-dfc4-491c-b668-d4eec3a2a847 [Sclerotinia trifoliorum]|uniref:717eb6c2-dfc4-491c-b668-d4eec3a2a847 n=1 Tax=Sclerotinia trifoliorum TaxID=28548 RepID=A0A8H2VMZ5_9HELO|nr:717eb6c2-dfc4-491c-b668-d4eec3a2a847 [Sclerotinia trifoliorum]